MAKATASSPWSWGLILGPGSLTSTTSLQHAGTNHMDLGISMCSASILCHLSPVVLDWTDGFGIPFLSHLLGLSGNQSEEGV